MAKNKKKSRDNAPTTVQPEVNNEQQEEVASREIEEDPLPVESEVHDSPAESTEEPVQVGASQAEEVPTQEIPRVEDKKDKAIESPKMVVEEATPEPEVKQAAPVQKKRLTLQERLALAAKSGKGKRAGSGASLGHDIKVKASTPEPASTRNSVDEVRSSPAVSTGPSTVPTRDTPADPQRNDKDVSLFPSNYKELPAEELWKLISDIEARYLSIESKNKSLAEEKHSLQEKVKVLNSAAASNSSKPSTQLDQRLKEKDQRIAQLLKEGEELSVKELKYNNTIKKLKGKEYENEQEIRSLEKKVSSLESENRDLKSAIKLAQENERQSTINSKTYLIQLTNEKESLKEELLRNEELSSKIEELSQVIIQEKNRYSTEINTLKRQLEKESNKLSIAQSEYAREVSRFEEKIEQLRFQAESAQTTTSDTDEGYSKLLRQYDVLQNQYTTATENWQSIEASLSGKVSDLEYKLSELQSQLSERNSKVDILSKDLSSKILEIENLKSQLESLKGTSLKQESEIKRLSSLLQESEETLEDYKLKSSQEKSQLEYKIQTLERESRDTIQAQQLTFPDYSSTPTFSRNVSASSLKFNSRNWENKDIGLGESSTTPLQSRKASAMFQPHGGFDGADDSYSDFGDNDTINSPVSQFNNGQRLDNNSSNAVGGTSVQLLGKMSSQVRRLETELSTLREEMNKLRNDKKAASEEIVRLMKENDEVTNYKSKIAELEETVLSYSKRHEKTLEILGEKSEQVEELKADVEDLKDICKLQVQQLVEMQNK